MDFDKLAEEALLSGKHEAWRTLVHEAFPVLMVAATSVLSNREDAEDVVQTAFERIFQRRKSYRGETFLPWAKLITRRLAFTQGGSIGRRRRFQGTSGMDANNLPDPRGDFREVIDDKDEITRRLARLPHCLPLLTDAQKEVIRLRFFREPEDEASMQLCQARPIRLIARNLGITEASVCGRLARATTSLQPCLDAR